MDLTKNVAFIDRSTAAKYSKRCCTAMRTSARAMCRLIQAIRRSFTQRCGNRAKDRGKTACSTAMAAAFDQGSSDHNRAGEPRYRAERSENTFCCGPDKNDRETLSFRRWRRDMAWHNR